MYRGKCKICNAVTALCSDVRTVKQEIIQGFIYKGER